MRLGKKRRQRPGRTVYWDVILALAVLLGVGLLFWTSLLISVATPNPHYPDTEPSAFRAYWIGNSSPLEQPLTMFAVTLLALAVYLVVVCITISGEKRRRRRSRFIVLAFAFVAIAAIAAVLIDLADVLGGRNFTKKWHEWVFGEYILLPSPHETQADREESFAEILRDRHASPDGYPARIGEQQAFLPDADTVRIGRTDYRLWGVDALQLEQICVAGMRRLVPCGQQARDAFRTLMHSAPPEKIHCFHHDEARYPRTISCRIGSEDAGAWLVRRGHAFPTRAGRFRYTEALREARANKAGAWATAFLLPKEWKAARCDYRLGPCRNPYSAD